MRKIVAIALCLLATAALVRSVTEVGPTTLTVQVYAGEDGPDITSRVRVLVGSVVDDARQTPTLGNISIIKPQSNQPHTYPIPSDRDVAVFVLQGDASPEQHIIRPDAGRDTQLAVTLNLGFVTITPLRTRGGPVARVDHRTGAGRARGTIQIADDVTLMLRGGNHVFVTPQETQKIRVTAGSEQAITIDDRHGELTLTPETRVAWQDSFPPLFYTWQRGDIRGAINTPTSYVPFGTHQITPYLYHRSNRENRRLLGQPQTVTVDAPEADLTLPISVQVVMPDLRDWDPDDLVLVDALLVSATDSGKPFATNRVQDRQAPLVFLTQDPDATYAVALVKHTRVLAIQPIGTIAIDAPQSVTIAPGGDADFCAQVMVDLDCSRLLPD